MMRTAALVLAVASTASAQICNSLSNGASEFFTTDLSATSFLFIIIMGTLVLFMQAGFAMHEAGSTGASSPTSVFFRNIGAFMFGMLGWYTFGWAWAYGRVYYDQEANEPTSSNEWFIGDSGYFLQNVNPCNYAYWYFGMTFAGVTAVIVNGAMSGRTNICATILATILMTSWVYPTIVHWTWAFRQGGNSWLAQGTINNQDYGTGYYDFAGSGVVHVTGGIAALVGAIMVGPRSAAQLAKDGIAKGTGHSTPLLSVGFAILFFGFIGFNAGSVGRLDTVIEGVTMSLTVVNTVLAACGGAIAVVLASSCRKCTWSIPQLCNGALAGMVAVCAGSNTIYPWAGWFTGFVAGFVYLFWSKVISSAGIDDPVDAFAVHWGAGAWGMIAVTLMAIPKEAPINQYGMGGIFYDAFDRAPWVRLGWAFLALLVITLWAATWFAILFSILKATGKLRINDEQVAGAGGIDKAMFGEYAYVRPATGSAGEAMTEVKTEDEATDSLPVPATAAVKTSQI